MKTLFELDGEKRLMIFVELVFCFVWISGRRYDAEVQKVSKLVVVKLVAVVAAQDLQ